MVRTYITSETKPHPLAIDDVAEVLRSGGMALVPTETVYGLSVAVRTSSGVPGEYGRIFELKRRDPAQTVPWLVDSAAALDVYAVDVSPDARKLADSFWPGALTMIVRASSAVPARLAASDGTIALRVSRSPVVAALIQACRSPLATTSANTHGEPAPVSFDQVEPRILQGVDVAVDSGPTMCAESSTIVSCVGGRLRVTRVGALSVDEIEAALGKRVER